jgi:hypothetical protein
MTKTAVSEVFTKAQRAIVFGAQASTESRLVRLQNRVDSQLTSLNRSIDRQMETIQGYGIGLLGTFMFLLVWCILMSNKIFELQQRLD